MYIIQRILSHPGWRFNNVFEHVAEHALNDVEYVPDEKFDSLKQCFRIFIEVSSKDWKYLSNFCKYVNLSVKLGTEVILHNIAFTYHIMIVIYCVNLVNLSRRNLCELNHKLYLLFSFFILVECYTFLNWYKKMNMTYLVVIFCTVNKQRARTDGFHSLWFVTGILILLADGGIDGIDIFIYIH